jgi:hypothetical protein
MAAAFIDHYLYLSHNQSNLRPARLQALAAGGLLLAVKQE